MSREIKFRGKCIYPGREAEGNFLKLIYGDLHKRDNEWFICHDNQWLEVDKETVGQYTGLKDKNGKEIYEGDIIKYGKNIFLIVYSENIASFTVDFKRTDKKVNCYPNVNKGTMLSAEVIGNIYENSEMLESEE